MFPLRLCGGKLVAVTRERRYGPSQLRVNDDDDVTTASRIVSYNTLATSGRSTLGGQAPPNRG